MSLRPPLTLAHRPSLPSSTSPPSPPTRERFEFVGGMRAFAAMQVLLLHYGGAFLPAAVGAAGTVHFSWEPAFARSPGFFLTDGFFAVGFFFVLSGFVLTPSFAGRRLSFGQNTVKRALRLGLPALGAAVLAVALLAVLPSAQHAAAVAAGSPWFALLNTGPRHLWPALGGIVREIVVGDKGLSVFSQISRMGRWLPASSQTASVDPPIWALHWELWGSLLVLAVAKAYRRLPESLFWVLFGALLVFTGTSFLSLFLIGFLAWVWRERLLHHNSSWISWAGAVAVVAGIVVALAPDPVRAMGFLTGLPGLHTIDTFQFQNAIAAGLVFLGLLANRPARTWLSSRPLAWLGSVSFSVYLIHFAILVTIVSLVFRAMAPHGYLGGLLVSLGVGVIATLLAATAFERLVDRPATWLANRSADLLRLPTLEVPALVRPPLAPPALVPPAQPAFSAAPQR